MGKDTRDYLRVDELHDGNDPLNIREWTSADSSLGDAQVFYSPDGQSAFVLFDIRDYSIYHWGAGMYFVMSHGRQKLFESGWRFEYKSPAFFQNGRYAYFYLDNISERGNGLVREAQHIFIRRGSAGHEYAALKVTSERNNRFAVSDDSVEDELEMLFYEVKGDKLQEGDKIRMDMNGLPWVYMTRWA